METRLNLRPGQNGTKALVHKYGERLVCVRYRYDAETNQRHKTVELIEETIPWHPRGSREQPLAQRAAHEHVLIKVAYEEKALRERIKRAGGQWRPSGKAWSIEFAAASTLGLLDRIVEDI